MNENNLSLTTEEVVALQTILGYVLYNKSPQLYSVALKLDALHSDHNLNYDGVVFAKTDEDGVEIKQYKHNNFTISFNGEAK